jgi:hypothetical protein
MDDYGIPMLRRNSELAEKDWSAGKCSKSPQVRYSAGWECLESTWSAGWDGVGGVTRLLLPL